jgi:transcriptional regulator with XRE-family HTH domain
MSWKQKLGEDIKRARNEFPGGSISQQQLAALVDFSRNTIMKYESGETVPDVEQLQKMGAALRRNYFDAGVMRIEFGGNGRPHAQPVPQQLELHFDDNNGVSIRIEPVSQGLIIKKLSA